MNGSFYRTISQHFSHSIGLMPHTGNINQSAEGNFAQERLSQYWEIVEEVFQKVGISYWYFDAVNASFEVSDNVLLQYKYDPKQFRKITIEQWKDWIHPDDTSAAILALTELLERKSESLDSVYRICDASGNYFYFHATGRVSAYSLDGKPIRLVGTLQNINEQREAEIRLHRKDALLEAVTECASVLVNAPITNFAESIFRVLEILGKTAGVDRVYVWKNSKDRRTKRLRSSQIYEWSPKAEPMQGNEVVNDVDFENNLPAWHKILSSGGHINASVRLLPKAERDILEPQGIVSILVTPIIFQDKFWGFLGLDDCRNERIWEESEIGILHSTALMIAATISRQDVEKSLAEERQMLDRIIESSPVLMVQTGRGIIKRINKRAAELFKCCPGQPSYIFYGGPEQRDAVCKAVIANGIYQNQNFGFTFADGTQRNFIITVFALNSAEEIFVTWFVDITDIQKIQTDLIKAYEKATAATQAKSEFLARMSHEIRTPMNAVLGLVYLCLQTNLNDKQRDYLVKVQTAANNLLGIINDILDFSKIEAGKIELERITFRLSDVFSELRDTIEFSAKEKGLQLNMQIASDVADDIVGDPLRLRQILLNFLSNAVKFTSEGSITVTADAMPPEAGKHPDLYQLEFSVTDTGIGLTQEQMEHIFDSFAQADTSIVRKYGGTGLGLSICKRLVELMDGNIDVSSEVGQGTKFHFTAYFVKASAKTEESSALLLNRRRVLVVDDEDETREVIVELIKTLNLQAEAAVSGTDALEKLTLATRYGNPYELVLMDWRMPQMDGIETIRQIHRRENIITPPHIVMISAYDRQDCLHQTAGLSVAGVLVKPVKVNDLKAVLKSAFRLIQKQSYEQTQELKADIKGASVLLAEDNKINQLVATELLKTYGVGITIANNGQEAVEAVKTKDFDLILMDVQMPEMDGLTATQIIRKLPKPGIDRLPILAMTANALDTDYQKSLDVGMNDHLTKPIDPAKLRLALEKWIKR